MTQLLQVARWRPRTLRGRLTAILLVLLLAAGLVTGVATAVFLRGFLVDRLDGQLQQAGGRFSASLEHRGSTQDRQRSTQSGADPDGPGGDDHGAAIPGQAAGTLGVRLVGGHLTQAAVVDEQGHDRSLHLRAADVTALADLPTGGAARTVHLTGLGAYRVQAVAGRDGDVQVTGLPLRIVTETIGRLALIQAGLFTAVLCVAGALSALWVRRALHPLHQVASTALHVSQLPLTDPATPLPTGLAPEDPRTEAELVSAAFDRMLDHLRGALAARDHTEAQLRRFVADASHELRTPLATIRAHTDYATRTDRVLPPVTSSALARIDSAATRMTVLVEDLLLLASLDAGRPLAREPVELTQLVLEAVGDARTAAPTHQWKLDLPEEPVDIVGDSHRLHQVLTNLLTNARQHTPAGTTVTTSLHRRRDAVEVSVCDDGPGLSQEHRENVFDRFSRGDPSRVSGHGGAGLGLAIAHGIVTAHLGTLDVDDRAEGTCFRVLLPFVVPEDGTPDSTSGT